MIKNPVPRSRLAKLKEASKRYADFKGFSAEEILEVDMPEFDAGLVIGELDEIWYTTVRENEHGKKEIQPYRHKFRKKARPMLCVTPDGCNIFVVGGHFRFTDRGFEDFK